jgi:hypothetical protein
MGLEKCKAKSGAFVPAWNVKYRQWRSNVNRPPEVEWIHYTVLGDAQTWSFPFSPHAFYSFDAHQSVR